MKKAMGVNGIPDADKKSCFDCHHCQANISWWCVNEEAISERGTRMPGATGCPFWKPIQTKEKLFNEATLLSKILGSYKRGYIEIDLSNNKEK